LTRAQMLYWSYQEAVSSAPWYCGAKMYSMRTSLS
jgi:hypothetical protein